MSTAPKPILLTLQNKTDLLITNYSFASAIQDPADENNRILATNDGRVYDVVNSLADIRDALIR